MTIYRILLLATILPLLACGKKEPAKPAAPKAQEVDGVPITSNPMQGAAAIQAAQRSVDKTNSATQATADGLPPSEP